MSIPVKSPFPGMDPFLEVDPRWQAFHGWFIRELARLNYYQARAADCWIEVERNLYQREPSGQTALIGEPGVLHGPDFFDSRKADSSHESNLAALAQPKAVHEVILDPAEMEIHKQDYLVVRDGGQFNRILAVLELLSLENKSGLYASLYREKRTRLLTSHAHFMEIDFLRAGVNRSRRLFFCPQSRISDRFLEYRSGMSPNPSSRIDARGS